MEKRGIKFLVIGILILIALLTFSNDLIKLPKRGSPIKGNENQITERNRKLISELAPKEIINTKLFVQTKEGLELYNPLNKKPNIILNEVYDYDISNSKGKIAYIKKYENPNNKKIYIYNLNTKEEKNIKTDFSYIRNVSWSPNDKYIKVNSGTGPIGKSGFYDPNTGKAIYTYRDSGPTLWVNDNIFITTAIKEIEPPRPWGEGYATGVKQINLLEKSEKDLKLPETRKDYRPEKIGNSKIQYSEITYIGEVKDWSKKENQTTNYYLMSLEGEDVVKGKLPTEDIERPEVLKYIRQREKSLKYVGFIEYPKNENWKIARVNLGDNPNNNVLYLFNKNKPEKLYKLGIGGNITWIAD